MSAISIQNIPGPGSAMAITAAVTVYSAAFAPNLSYIFRYSLLLLAAGFGGLTLLIERLHKQRPFFGEEKPKKSKK